MLPARWIWLKQRWDMTKFMSPTGRTCSVIMAQAPPLESCPTELQAKGIKHTRSAAYHPQIEGKIEWWHQTLKNPILHKTTAGPANFKPKSTQLSAINPRYQRSRHTPNARRGLLPTPQSSSTTKGKEQTKDTPSAP
jgi:hypothetical protein